MNNTIQRVKELKQADQDFEWYPTTDGMIHAIFRTGKIKYGTSILDVGAGDGRVLEILDKLTFEREKSKGEDVGDFTSQIHKYAIEKSTVHLDKMPADVSVVGTDFHLQTLIDKKMDIVFCNPPYSEYEAWAVKCIKEANTKDIFLILPARWADSTLIKAAIQQRQAAYKVIQSGDFLTADREARARIDIIRVMIHNEDNRHFEKEHDPFNVWFDEHFAGFSKPVLDEDEDPEEKKKPTDDLLTGQNLIERLCELYRAKMSHLLENYQTLAELDADLLDELGITKQAVREGLKSKIEGLKHKYWRELFDNLDKITSRLTSGSRQKMLDKLQASCNVDFNEDNAYAVILWAIKNANKYIDQQLIDMFKGLSEPENVKNYKSNQRVWSRENWRWRSDRTEHSHYGLELRIIKEMGQAAQSKDSYYSHQFTNGLDTDCHKLINDIFTIANNLLFTNLENTLCETWNAGTNIQFYGEDRKVLLQVKAFKKGTLHFKFRQDFIKALNIEASRLLGWIKTPEQAAEEMNIDVEFVRARYGSNLLFSAADGQKLLGS